MDGVKVSSTAIRRSLAEGRVRRASAFLGRPYDIAGVVVRGEGLGGRLGFPTANIEVSSPEKLLPRRGVYVVRARFGEEVREGIMNIGQRPTVSQQMHISMEVHIFPFSGDLYGMHMRVELLERLRDEIRFDSVAQLTAQIESDIAFAKEYLSRTQQQINE
jgi:riboflavin kinase/FMN adenylyltransferase